MSKSTLATQAYVDGKSNVANGFAALDGGSGLLVPAHMELANLGSAPAAPVAGKTRVYVDASGLLQVVPAAGSTNRRIVAHWGSGTAFPTGPAAGDTFLRTDVGTNGSVYQYTGNTAIGSNGWIVEGSVVCTSTTRPTSGLYASLPMYETDTSINWQWSGTTWQAVGGLVPGVRAGKTGTQAVTNAWTLLTWDTPTATPATTGMFASANPSRLVAPYRGRYRVMCQINGPTNLQLRYNSAGNATTGSMQGASVVSAINLQHTATIDEITMNANDYIEAFGYSTSAANMGSQAGYSAYFTMSYIAPA